MADPSVSNDRLVKVAKRRLDELRIQSTISAGLDCLVGEFSFSQEVRNPLTKTGVKTAQFATVGHDRLRFLDPPWLAAVGEVSFFECESAGDLTALVERVLERRPTILYRQAVALKNLGYEMEIVDNALIGRLLIKVPAGELEIIADQDGLRAERLRLPRADKVRQLTPVTLELGGLDDKVDVEFYIQGLVEKALLEPEPPPNPKAERPRPAQLVSLPAAEDELDLVKLARAFGGSALVAGGVWVRRKLQKGNRNITFEAMHKSGLNFQGRLSEGPKVIWEDQFELGDFPGLDNLCKALLGEIPIIEKPATPEEDTGPRDASWPNPGETWVMDVVVERGSDSEVRYTAIDSQGQPYGAARILAKDDFERAFIAHGGGYRLAVLIEASGASGVKYRHLDGAKEPTRIVKTSPMAAFIGAFISEAAAY